MNTLVRIGLLATVFGGLVVYAPSLASADGKKEIKNLLRQQARIQRALKKKLAKTSPTALRSVVFDHRLSRLTDSDGDGVADYIELSDDLDVCDRDSDDDGVEDGDEFENETDPDEVEAKGIIAAFSPTSITVTRSDASSITYAIDNNTELDDPLEQYVLGAEVEVEGKYKLQPDASLLLVAKHVELHDVDDDDDENDHDDNDD